MYKPAHNHGPPQFVDAGGNPTSRFAQQARTSPAMSLQDSKYDMHRRMLVMQRQTAPNANQTFEGNHGMPWGMGNRIAETRAIYMPQGNQNSYTMTTGRSTGIVSSRPSEQRLGKVTSVDRGIQTQQILESTAGPKNALWRPNAPTQTPSPDRRNRSDLVLWPGFTHHDRAWEVERTYQAGGMNQAGMNLTAANIEQSVVQPLQRMVGKDGIRTNTPGNIRSHAIGYFESSGPYRDINVGVSAGAPTTTSGSIRDNINRTDLVTTHPRQRIDKKAAAAIGLHKAMGTGLPWQFGPVQPMPSAAGTATAGRVAM